MKKARHGSQTLSNSLEQAFHQLKLLQNSLLQNKFPAMDKAVTHALDTAIDSVTTNRLFLEGMSTLLNLNSYSRIATKKGLRGLWKALELPNKYDQEKTLYLVSELQFKIQRLEKQLEQKKIDDQTAETTIIAAKRKTKNAMGSLHQ
jgi:hypothetical protein